MEYDESEPFQDWTSCEMHGHDYADVEGQPGVRRCADCGDEYRDTN